MPVISVINYKGGVGKTTVAANVAADLAYRGKKILLIDMDAQCSLTFSFIKPDVWERDFAPNSTILKWYESFESGNPLALESMIHSPALIRSKLSGRGGTLDIIPSHLGLINVDLDLATELGGASLKQTRQKFMKVHRRLLEGLKAPEFDTYDAILIDCPPNFNIVTKTAIIASDLLLVPAKADYLSTLGIDFLRRSLSELVENHNEFATGNFGGDVVEPIDPKILGVAFTMLQFYAQVPTAAQRPYIQQVRNLGIPVLAGYTRENKRMFAEAPEYGVPVTLTESNFGTQVVSELEQLAREIETLAGI